VSDGELLERVLAELAGRSEPVGMGVVQRAVKGDDHRIREVVLAALESGSLRNVSARNDRYAILAGGTSSTGDTGELAEPAQTRLATDVEPGGVVPPASTNRAEKGLSGVDAGGAGGSLEGTTGVHSTGHPPPTGERDWLDEEDPWT